MSRIDLRGHQQELLVNIDEINDIRTKYMSSDVFPNLFRPLIRRCIKYAPEDICYTANSCFQDDVIVAANVGGKAISDMLTTC